MERTPNKSQHTKLNYGEEYSPAAPVGIRTRNLSITSPVLYQQAIPGSTDIRSDKSVASPMYLERFSLSLAYDQHDPIGKREFT